VLISYASSPTHLMHIVLFAALAPVFDFGYALSTSVKRTRGRGKERRAEVKTWKESSEPVLAVSSLSSAPRLIGTTEIVTRACYTRPAEQGEIGSPLQRSYVAKNRKWHVGISGFASREDC
jgi:hypothetical protein